jgi:tricarballylate dehydrogenase
VSDQYYDVVVVGSGNAGLSAAHAAREQGASVLVLEKGPVEWVGGNSYFTAGALRFPHGAVDDLLPLLDELDPGEVDRIDLPPYSEGDFLADMRRVTRGRCDETLTSVLVREAADAVRWLHGHGIRLRLMHERQAYESGGRLRFWGGLAVGVVGGGQGLIAQHLAAAQRSGIEVRVDSPVEELLFEDEQVTGVAYRGDGHRREVSARAVVLAAGGFEADPRLRAAYLGPAWDLAKVRGTPHNSGEVLLMAIEAGAQPFGHWSGRHAIAWERAAPDSGDRELTNRFSRQSYPIGIVVNERGERFLDEGADFRNYTYAEYGAAILEQPGGIAFQLFDAKTLPLVSRIDYAHPGNSGVQADTVQELADRLGLPPDALARTVEDFNAAVQPGAFDPSIKDGKGTEGLTPPKSNWAQALDTPPYAGFPVTCGITFTFGGVKIDVDGRVLDRTDTPIGGLYAAGELVGGLFYYNYPGGSGLTSGLVFGRRAGATAARTLTAAETLS